MRTALAALLITGPFGPSFLHADDDNAAQQTGFAVHKDSDATTDSFEDFERFRDKKQWEKAISALAKIDPATASGLVPDKDGFLISSAQKAREELLSLPPDGREAFRLFNDAKAEQLYQQATAPSADHSSGGQSSAASIDDVALLRQIVDRYFVTSIGDRAADRLGDALFESGDFAGAAQCWKLVLDQYPDTSLSTLMLQVKLATALADAERWDEFSSVQATVNEKSSPGQTVLIGGKQVVAADYISGLAANRTASPAATQPDAADSGLSASTLVAPSSAAPVVLPSSNEPIWQIPLFDQDSVDQFRAALSNFGWQSMVGMYTNVVPPTALDDQRIYVNWFGCGFAADLKTGKMLWRNDPVKNLAQTLQQAIMQGQLSNMSGFSVALAGDRVLFVRSSLSNMMNGPSRAGLQLSCVHADSGKSVWNSDSGPLQQWGLFGRPLVINDRIYICAHQQQQNGELSLLCIDLDKGKLNWNVALGTPTQSTDFRGQPVETPPTLAEHNGALYVLTNNGALIAIDTLNRKVAWAFTYPTAPATGPQQMFYNEDPAPDTNAPGALLWRGADLYFKETAGDAVYAIDPSGPSLLWKRAADPDVGLVACDGKQYWLAGVEVDCIDMATRSLKWSDKLSVQTGSIQPLLDGDRLYLFGARGVHRVDLQSGEAAPIFRGYEKDMLGGVMWRTGDRLITVSKGAITAYAVDGD